MWLLKLLFLLLLLWLWLGLLLFERFIHSVLSLVVELLKVVAKEYATWFWGLSLLWLNLGRLFFSRLLLFQGTIPFLFGDDTIIIFVNVLECKTCHGRTKVALWK